MKHIAFVVGLILSFVVKTSEAENRSLSLRTEIFENPYLAVGYNTKDGVMTGYFSALRIAPRETNECKLVFKATVLNQMAAAVSLANASSGLAGENKFIGRLELTNDQLRIVLDKAKLPGDCDWVLPFIGYPTVEETKGRLVVSINPTIVGEWQGVGAVMAKKAFFHQAPDDTSRQKAYLVSGDYFYIFDERPGWYFVKFQGRKKEVSGWIKMGDTIQF